MPVKTQQPSDTKNRSLAIKVSEEVRQNEFLQSKIKPLLPKNTDPVRAAEGFPRLDQFFASANAAKNLVIPFARFKSHFLGSANGSLDQTISALKPALTRDRVAEEVAKAESQANEQIVSAMAEYRWEHSGSDKSERPVAGRP